MDTFQDNAATAKLWMSRHGCDAFFIKAGLGERLVFFYIVYSNLSVLQ